jgi:Tetratricopeptide repeat
MIAGLQSMVRGMVIAGSIAGFAVLCAPATMAQKDPPSEPSKCDRFKKGSADWRKCVGRAANILGDNELFYAGYWLARVGRYDDALAYLLLVRTPDARTLTYTGFATRKLGDTDRALAFYAQALTLNPRYTVARAYLGEALVERGAIDAARVELAAIRDVCGETCVDYLELARQIDAHGAHAHGGWLCSFPRLSCGAIGRRRRSVQWRRSNGRGTRCGFPLGQMPQLRLIRNGESGDDQADDQLHRQAAATKWRQPPRQGRHRLR